MNLHYPVLCFITTESSCPPMQAEKTLKGGAHMIQLRHKSASGSELYRWSVDIKRLCKRYNAIFIVNDRLDIALAADADGVHLGQEDFPPDMARKMLGKGKILGVSVSSVSEARSAEQSGADYIGLGHIFSTTSKQKSGKPIGPGRIPEIVDNVSIPVIAIGGITEKNTCEIMRRGASGIAVISAIAESPNPETATAGLIKNMQSCLQSVENSTQPSLPLPVQTAAEAREYKPTSKPFQPSAATV